MSRLSAAAVAVAVNVEIMRAFVRLREMAAGHIDLVKRIDDLEKRYDKQFCRVFEAIRALVKEEGEPPKSIGFRTTGKVSKS